MKNLLILLLLMIIIVSCGKNAEPPSDGTSCSTNSDIFNRTWDRDGTSQRYDMTTCSKGVTCRICFNIPCTTVNDVDVTYYDGQVTLNYFNGGGSYSGQWQICNGNFLRIYNLSGNASDETFHAIN